MSDAHDPYEVLGVPRYATTIQIRAAYVERARQAHPDLVGGTGLEMMRALNEAWDVLKDAGRRALYDASSTTGASGTITVGVTEPTSTAATASKPFWTGAAGPPPGRPSGSVLDFGIYDGWSLGEVARLDRGYLAWLRDRREAKALRAEIAHLLDPPQDDTDSGRRRGR